MTVNFKIYRKHYTSFAIKFPKQAFLKVIMKKQTLNFQKKSWQIAMIMFVKHLNKSFMEISLYRGRHKLGNKFALRKKNTASK